MIEDIAFGAELEKRTARVYNMGETYVSVYKPDAVIVYSAETEYGMKDVNCGYCMRGELLEKFGIFICELKVSSLILFKEQSKPGRCIVAYREHVSEIVDISPEERSAFLEDVAHAAKAIHAAFHPDKLNYGAYGDTGCHLHMHLVPKYKDGDEWGSTFQMNPDKKYLTAPEYEEMIKRIRDNL